MLDNNRYGNLPANRGTLVDITRQGRAAGTQRRCGALGAVYSDDSSRDREIVIKTNGQFSGLTGVIGIDGDAECRKTPASVHITDGTRTIWPRSGEPTEVRLHEPQPFSIEIMGAQTIVLTVNTADPNASCDHRRAEPGWGDVEFTPGD